MRHEADMRLTLGQVGERYGAVRQRRELLYCLLDDLLDYTQHVPV
jgi:hypothetical protein